MPKPVLLDRIIDWIATGLVSYKFIMIIYNYIVYETKTLHRMTYVETIMGY